MKILRFFAPSLFVTITMCVDRGYASDDGCMRGFEFSEEQIQQVRNFLQDWGPVSSKQDIPNLKTLFDQTPREDRDVPEDLKEESPRRTQRILQTSKIDQSKIQQVTLSDDGQAVALCFKSGQCFLLNLHHPRPISTALVMDVEGRLDSFAFLKHMAGFVTAEKGSAALGSKLAIELFKSEGTAPSQKPREYKTTLATGFYGNRSLGVTDNFIYVFDPDAHFRMKTIVYNPSFIEIPLQIPNIIAYAFNSKDMLAVGSQTGEVFLSKQRFALPESVFSAHPRALADKAFLKKKSYPFPSSKLQSLALALSEDGRFLAAGSKGALLVQERDDAGKVLKSQVVPLEKGVGPIQKLRFLGERLLIKGETNSILSYNTKRKKFETPLQIFNGRGSLVRIIDWDVSLKHETVLILSQGELSLSYLDTREGEILAGGSIYPRNNRQFTQFALSADSNTCVLVDSKNDLTILDIGQGIEEELF